MSSATSARRGEAPPNWLARGISLIVIGLVLLLIYLAFRSRSDEFPTKYGQRRGSGAAESVNGTAVLAALFEQAGHRVHSSVELNRRLDKDQTVVWIPDSFEPPSTEARQFLDAWLQAEPGRTLVYIGRDYDAASEYWRQMLAQVDNERYDDYLRRLAHAQSEFAARRCEFPQRESCEWFVMKGDQPTRKIPDLDGPWAAGVDAAKTDITLAGRLDIPDPANTSTSTATSPNPYAPADNYVEVEVLLQSENDILAHRYRLRYWNESQVIVVANGSFSLNMGLVNKEHRKLAAQLVAECGEPGSVAFLESGPRGVTVNESHKEDASSHALRIFTVWPISFIFIHFAALGIVYCISVFPIFGRPQHLPGQSRSDFGQHIAALGELLRGTKDTLFAETRIRQYQTQAKRGSGHAHKAAATAPLVATVLEPIEIKPIQPASSQQDLSQPQPAADSVKPTP